MSAVAPARARSERIVAGGLLSWLATTDHKRIGILYFLSTLAYFLVAGTLALIIRAQLTVANLHLVSAHAYNAIFTLHGTAMIFLFVAPFAFGLGNYLLPLQIGAPDRAYPV